MFQEDCCLQCGNPVLAEGRIYCSDECESLDTSSPSISTASSAFSSPHLDGYDMPGAHDVPALVPSALGAALSFNHQKHHYPLSSSKSSLAWYEDDDSDGLVIALDDEDSDLGFKSTRAAPLAIRPTGLSYARRPSSTNNHSTIPLLHRRTSSGNHSLGTAYSMTSTRSSTEDSDGPIPASPPSLRARSPHGHRRHPSATDAHQETITAKRKHNRLSMPAYFSLLQHGSLLTRTSTSAQSPTSFITTRPSPTTPRLAGPALDHTHALAVSSPSSGMHYSQNHNTSLLASVHTTDDGHIRESFGAGLTPPRGRRREPGTSRRRTCSRSPSPSPSRARRALSPPLLLKEEPASEVRGRRRVNELDGWGEDKIFGFGNGRSGLKERERGRGRER